jgi:wyosine [tRNA(Phe)-imidazoG37] synthetase (radical SAM superfamily)
MFRDAVTSSQKHVFGPVPSRRLGQSLGIDTILLKTCNWNCVYCQLGRSTPLVNERKNYIVPEVILAEVQLALAAHRPGEIDWITFVGSGEPTLHASLGLLIRQVKTLTDVPVAVITNGSLLYRPEVRQELLAADAVLPTLDAGDADLYRKINRPWPELTFERLVDGLIAFRREYTGRLWIEVMLVKGLNDTEQALRDIAVVLSKILEAQRKGRQTGPNAVHINLPSRPPAETWVQPPNEEGLMRATAILGDIARVVHPVEGTFDFRGCQNLTDAIVGIITRHPIREVELRHALERWTPGQVEIALSELEVSGQAQVVERYGMRFWSAAASRYPDETHSRRAAPGDACHVQKR